MSASVTRLAPASETLAQRVQRLQAEAQLLAVEDVGDLLAAMNAVAARAVLVATGGDVYPPGVRDQAARVAEMLAQRGQTMAAILERVS